MSAENDYKVADMSLADWGRKEIAIAETEMELTFITYDDHDHRVVVIRRPGWGTKPDRPVGLSHIAFAYASLGELIFIYKTLKAAGHPPPHWTVNRRGEKGCKRRRQPVQRPRLRVQPSRVEGLDHGATEQCYHSLGRDSAEQLEWRLAVGPVTSAQAVHAEQGRSALRRACLAHGLV